MTVVGSPLGSKTSSTTALDEVCITKNELTPVEKASNLIRNQLVTP